VGSSTVRGGHLLRRSLLLMLVGLGPLIAGSATSTVLPQPSLQSIPLECRVGKGPWQACRMEVVAMGSQWALLVGGQRWEFRHDGHGSVTMQQGTNAWRPVSSHWEDRNNLCWDGLCARGDIPLD
jgi:hypothetical protein